MTSDLKTRIESGDLHFLDGLVLLGTIASQRWFGGKSKDVLDARVLDAGVTPGEPPILAIAIVEVRYGLQTHDLYHLPLGFRPSGDGWTQSVIAETEGWVAYDAIADPELARRMLELMRQDASLQTPEATIVFRPTGELAGEFESVRPMGAEQSNSSLVLDELYVLKLYRRIAPGMNPELEVLRFLTERGFEHTPALEGYIAYEGRPLEATLATVQEFVPAKGDGWDLRARLARGRRARLAPRARAPARRGDRAPPQRARLRPDRPALRARGSEHGGARAPVGLDRRGDRARLRGAARHSGARAGRAAAARRCATISACSRTSGTSAA